LLEKALEAVRRLPPDSQDEIALAMLTLSGHAGEPEEIDPAHLPAVLEGLAQGQARSIRNRCRDRSRVPPLRAKKLRFTPRAVRDLTAIADYIHEQSPQAALRVRAAIVESLQSFGVVSAHRAATSGRGRAHW
jgi:hypothetical protein